MKTYDEGVNGLLDSELIDQKKVSPSNADLGSRFGNFLIDRVFVSILMFTGISLTSQIEEELISGAFLIIYIGYYALSETLFGQTLGKVITGTVVVDKNWSKPHLRRVLMRFLIRHLGIINVLSFIFSSRRRGLHDLASGTYVVNKRDLPS